MLQQPAPPYPDLHAEVWPESLQQLVLFDGVTIVDKRRNAVITASLDTVNKYVPHDMAELDPEYLNEEETPLAFCIQESDKPVTVNMTERYWLPDPLHEWERQFPHYGVWRSDEGILQHLLHIAELPAQSHTSCNVPLVITITDVFDEEWKLVLRVVVFVARLTARRMDRKAY